MNLDSLLTSFEHLLDTIKYADPSPDIIGLCETMYPKGKFLPMIPGYQVHHNSADTGKRGTAIYAKDHLNSREINP